MKRSIIFASITLCLFVLGLGLLNLTQKQQPKAEPLAIDTVAPPPKPAETIVDNNGSNVNISSFTSSKEKTQPLKPVHLKVQARDSMNRPLKYDWELDSAQSESVTVHNGLVSFDDIALMPMTVQDQNGEFQTIPYEKSFLPISDGDYRITVHVTNESGITDSKSITINVSSLP